METCIVDDGEGLRLSPVAWMDFCAQSNEQGSEANIHVPDPETSFFSDLFEWSAATYSYDVLEGNESMRLPMKVKVSVDNSGLACRIGKSDVERYFDEHVNWETNTTIFEVRIAKPVYSCVARKF